MCAGDYPPARPMDMSVNKSILLSTAKGVVKICVLAGPEDIRTCTFDGQLTPRSTKPALMTGRRLLEKFVGQPDASIVVAQAEHNHVIGYGILAYPEPNERWADLGPKVMMEVKAIEVARSWRSYRIASAILKRIIRTPQIEEKIIYMVGYSWTWDLVGIASTPQQYRQVLIRLFEPHGFKQYQTNEPNVCLKPENLFMCRVGKHVPRVLLDRFKWLRFGLSPWSW